MPDVAILYSAGGQMRGKDIREWKESRHAMLRGRSDDYVRQFELDAFRLACLKMDPAEQEAIQGIVRRISKQQQNLGEVYAVEVLAKIGILMVGMKTS